MKLATLRQLVLLRQFVARRLLAVAHIESAVRHDGMVPRLAVDRVEAAWQLAVLLRCRGDQRNIALLADDEEKILVSEQQHLAGVIAADAPAAFAVLNRDAGQEWAVKAVKIALVDDEIVEIRADRLGGPDLLRRPRRARWARTILSVFRQYGLVLPFCPGFRVLLDRINICRII